MILKIDEEVKGSKKVNLTEPTIKINREEMCVEISYDPQTTRVSYSISDTRGKIICTGDLSSGKATCHGKDKNMQPGTYNLMVIDGDQTIRKQFELA